ncbi:MAG: hypothetical protein ACRD13_03495 [Terriglobales bacterium]
MSTTSESVSAVAPGVGERRIVAAVEDLFFLAKIQETARQLGVHLTVAKTEDQILQLVQGEPAPTLIILDLNGSATKPLAVIAQLRKDPALKKTSLVGFLSHLQADLKVQAQEAGCDLVMPRSAFSQNLPSLLRRHGLPEQP